MTISIREPKLDGCSGCSAALKFVIDIGVHKISVCEGCIRSIHKHVHSVLKLTSLDAVVATSAEQMLSEIKRLSQAALDGKASYMFKQGHDNILRLIEDYGKPKT